jgi:hypothetical protein
MRIADQVWASHNGVFNILLVALPVSAGLSLSAGRPAARWAWMLSALAGAVGFGLHLSRTAVVFEPVGWDTRLTPLGVAGVAVVWVVLGVLARLAWTVRRGRMHEGPRWLAVALTFVLFAVCEPFVPLLSGPAVALLSVAAGMVVGTMRADRRAIRSGREIRPLHREAA